MPQSVNRDQILAHQIHLLEVKLRNKEERILELESENALLRMRLAECLRRVCKDPEEKAQLQKNNHCHEKIQNIQSILTKLLSKVQILKGDLRDVFALYAHFRTELGCLSKQLLDRVATASYANQVNHGNLLSLKGQVEILEQSLWEEKERSRAERMRRKHLHNILIELRGNIRVHCRVRPVLPFDSGSAPSASLSGPSPEQVVNAINDDTILVNCYKAGNFTGSKMFEFERVHGPENSQDDVFEEVKPLVGSLLDSYNVCIMAYGHTGSGKTYSMFGSHTGDPADPSVAPLQGIIPKAAAELFRLVSEKPPESHTVEVSILEVHNNEVYDLLAKDCDGVSVRVKRDVITTSLGTNEVPSLIHVGVNSPAEVMQHISSVLHLRTHVPTLIHTDASRSHLVVTLTVTSKISNTLALASRVQNTRQKSQGAFQKEQWSPRCHRAAARRTLSPASSPFSSPGHTPSSSHRLSIAQAHVRTKLQLVDLAGSECAGVSGVSGNALWESSCINRSLSALSDVLGALAEQRPHIPYRNSKLTHLLQDSIGGDAKMLVLLCVSPTQRFVTESLQCLSFGTRVQEIQRQLLRKKTEAFGLK